MKEIKKIKKTGRVTLLSLAAIFLLMFGAVAFSFGSMAITGRRDGHNLAASAVDALMGIERVQGRRGDILDRNGSIIATEEASFILYANFHPDWNEVAWGGTGYVEDIQYTARQLSSVLDASEGWFLERLSSGALEVEFRGIGQLSVRQRNEVKALGLPGINFIPTVMRTYPNGVFASHTIGFATLDNEVNELHGQMGIEQYFNQELQGTKGAVVFLQDGRGRLQPNRERNVVQQYQDGYTIYISIDSGIQLFLEEALEQVWQSAQPESLMAIVADPRTGELLAMGSRSTFDPNTRDNIDIHHNVLINYAVEPGSTMKIYTYAAAIEEGNFVGSQTFASGTIPLFGGTIRDWNGGIGWGNITFNEGFYTSANTGIIHMLNDMITPQRMLERFADFGFGRNVGIQLFNEQPGMLPFYANIVQQFNAGFGQGLTTTPIQHIQAMTAILNDGEMIRPQIISRIVNPNTGEIVHEPGIEVVGHPISAQTARQVMDLMVGVVEDPVGTGRNLYRLNGVSSGGKTGTAQIPDSVYGGYLDGQFRYSYVGFAPADNPRLVMYVAMSSPTQGEGGHESMSQIYRFVMNQSLAYLGMERQEQVALSDVHDMAEVGSVLNLDVSRASEMVTGWGLEPVIIGQRSQVFAQLPSSGTLAVAGTKVFLQTEAAGPLPDFTGWTRSEVNQFGLLTGQEFILEGDGLVVSQSEVPGTLPTEFDAITLVLSRREAQPEEDSHGEAFEDETE
ncbi:MAG: penicillin-binding transpeptidase domain-containing protein [Turicibacter sp.]|nr:penicillin-binding transpeptidase domain-containing protein [Turicibacter sp.]